MEFSKILLVLFIYSSINYIKAAVFSNNPDNNEPTTYYKGIPVYFKYNKEEEDNDVTAKPDKKYGYHFPYTYDVSGYYDNGNYILPDSNEFEQEEITSDNNDLMPLDIDNYYYNPKQINQPTLSEGHYEEKNIPNEMKFKVTEKPSYELLNSKPTPSESTNFDVASKRPTSKTRKVFNFLANLLPFKNNHGDKEASSNYHGIKFNEFRTGHHGHKKPYPYTFGYNVHDTYGNTQWRNEEGSKSGSKRGSYGYTDSHGVKREVHYIADHKGFRAWIKTNEPGTANSNPAHVSITAEKPPLIPQQHGNRGHNGFVVPNVHPIGIYGTPVLG